MSDIAQLGYEIDSSQAITAAKNLDGMAKASVGAERGSDRVAAAARKAADEIDKMASQIGIAVTAIAGAFGLLLKKQLDYADSVGKMADKLGVTTEFISVMGFAAKSNGSNVESMNRALFNLVDSMKRVEGGSKSQADAFRQIGVSVYSTQGGLKTVEQLLPEVARGLSGITDPTERAALAQKVLGEGSKDLLLALQDLSDKGIQGVTDKAAQFGQVVSKEMAKAAADANDALDALKNTATGFANQLLANLLPAISGVTGATKDGVVSIDDMKAAADGVATGIKYLAVGFNFTKNSVEDFVLIIAAAVSSLTSLATAAGSVVSGLVSGAKAVLDVQSGNFASAQKMVAESKASFAGMAQAGVEVKAAWQAAADGIRQNDAEFAQFKNKMVGTFAEVKSGASTAAVEAKKAYTELPPLVHTYAEEQAQLAKAAKEAAKANKEAAQEAIALSNAQKSALDMLDGLRGKVDATSAAQAEFDRGMRELQQRMEAWAIAGGDVAQILSLWQQGEEMLRQNLARTNAEILKRNQITNGNRDLLSVLAQQRAQLAGLTTAQQRYNQSVIEANAQAKKAAKLGIDQDKILAGLQDRLKLLAQIRDNEDVVSLVEQFGGKSEWEKLIENIEKVGEKLKEATDPETVKGLQRALGQLRHSMVTGIVQSSQDGLRALQSMTKDGSKAFMAMQIAIDALTVVQAISAVLNQGQGDPYTAFARMAAMAAAVASLGVSISNFRGTGLSDTSAQHQATQGTGSVLGDTTAKSESIAKATEITANATQQLVGLNRGMLSALQALQSALGSAGGMLARGAGQADFSGMKLATKPFDFKDPLTNMLLGGKSKVTDQGIVIMGGALNDMLQHIAVGAYQEVKSKSWAFGSTKTKTGIKDVSDEFEKQFGLVMQSIADTVREGAKALGMLPADIEAAMAAFKVEETKISLKGLSAEEQQKAIEAVFSKIFDGLAGAVVPYIEQFQKVGEGLGETLVRIATEVQVTQEAFKQLGFAVDQSDPEKFAQISDALIQASGGLDDFISGMQSFVANFASPEHQFQVASDAIKSAFDQVGLSVPATRDGMWQLMQSLDATTASGREQIATLLRLADTSNQYYDALDKRAEAALNYAQMVLDLDQQIAEASGHSSEFQRSLAGIVAQEKDAAASLNAAARAAGLQGAREQDLAKVHELAALRASAALRALDQASMDIISRLRGTDGLTGAASSASSSLATVADGLDSVANAAQKFRDSMLIDSQLSPLNTQQQYQEALKQLRITGDEGTARRALELARSLTASGADYKAMFDQITALVRSPVMDASTGGGYDASGTSNSTQLSAIERSQLAQQLAQNVADKAGFTGETFADVANGWGYSLGELSRDLGFTGDQLNTYLQSLQADSYGLSDLKALEDGNTDRIVNAILHGQDTIGSISTTGVLGSKPGGPETAGTIPQVNVVSGANGEAPATDTTAQATNAKLDAVAGLLTKVSELMLANVKATAGGTEELVEALDGVRSSVDDVRREIGGSTVNGENFRTVRPLIR